MKTPDVEANVDLSSHNTLRLPGHAARFARATTPEAVVALLDRASADHLPVFILGSGSNVVLCSDFPGLVIAMGIRERHWAMVDDDTAILALGAGENWHDTVMYACRAGFRGIENLALIPGTVGAAPVQNIGAYGVELRQVLVDVEAWDRLERRWRTLTCDECAFQYRDSCFKQQPDRFVITRVRLQLSRKVAFNLSYGELNATYGHLREPCTNLTPLAVAETVSHIRQGKLPDPDLLPNVGSFFKNPVVSPDALAGIRERWPDVIAYPEGDHFKLAAGWLIDQCGWRGHREAHVGVHSRQALVLIHHGNGTGAELLALADRIRADVEARFGVWLEMEPRRIGTD